jgi:hypothetical protein
MSQGTSLGVLVPTRNSAVLLPAHLSAMQSWLDLAEQVVVVDSFSTDGTEALLRHGIRHPALRVLSHPPGLYASWNAGLQVITTRHVYISTVGDTITRAGLEQLLDTARRLETDVVISKPAFQRPNGDAVDATWPIDDIVRSLGVTKPRRLQRLEAVVFACLHATGALTGSCASDLFRIDTLKRFPFPTEFGTSGDGIWSVRHAAQVSWAVVPDIFSTFLLHATGASQAENPCHLDAPRADDVLRNAARRWVEEELVSEAELRQLDWDGFQTALTAYLNAKIAFDRYRKNWCPWVVNPWAWRVMTIRTRSRATLESLKQKALRSLAITAGAVSLG